MRNIFLLSIVGAILFAACKKDHPQEPVNSTPTLLGKWTLDSTIVKEYHNGILTYQNATAATGMLWAAYDFRADGNVQAASNLASFLYPYSIGGSTVSFNGQQYEIRDLALTTVTLFYRTDYTGFYDEKYLKLKR